MNARREHGLLPTVTPSIVSQASLGAPWQSVGPAQVLTAAYGKVTGRVTSIAIDPADTSGNTVYIGTTGGGVWKSINAAGSAANVSFVPLTDVLTTINNGDESSISIGAVTVQPGGTGVILAGTGDPNDSFDSYYGTGLLRSTDHGLTWSLISQSSDANYGPAQNFSFVGEAFAGFAWSTANPALVVAAVSQAAEGIYVNAVDYGNSVEGLYYSSDAGASWQLATITDGPHQLVQAPQTRFAYYDGNAATSIVWNPMRQRFYAAIRYHGYYESSDGATFTRIANQPGNNFSARFCPPNTGSPGSTACPIFRGTLAVQPVTGDTFALTVDNNNQDQGLWQDLCTPVSGSCPSGEINFSIQLNTTALEAGLNNATIPQGDYNLWLSAMPQSGDTIVYAGTIDIFRCSLASGCPWRNTTNTATCAAAMVAPSQHGVAVLPSLPLLMYFGNDGGLWRTTDGVQQQGSVCAASDATHYDNLNGGLESLGEVASLAQSSADPTILLTGLGTNGTAATPGPSTPAQTPWPQVLNGEGSTTAIDPGNPQNWYAASSIGVAIQQCTQGTACTQAGFTPVIGDAQVGGDNSALVVPAPFILDSADSTQIIVGTCRVWRGPASGNGWSAANAISPLLDGVPGPVCNGNSALRSLASAPAGNNSTWIYAGMQGLFGNAPGHLYRAKIPDGPSSGIVAWTDISLSPVASNYSGNGPHFNPGGFDVSSIAVDPHDATGQTIYVTIEGFTRNGISEPAIYRSIDAGAHWINIHGNLPSAPGNSVVVDPQNASTVYVALDTGVYVTQSVSTCGQLLANCWSVYGVGLPNSPVTQLLAPAGSGTLLRAGTYGRGVWEIALLPPPTTDTVATISPPAVTFPDQLEQTQSAPQTLTISNTGTLPLVISEVTITGDSGDFIETDNCVNTAVPPGGSCTLQVIFNPTTLGTRTGNLVASANVAGGQISALLTGNGAAQAAALLVPDNMDFGTVPVGTTSAVQSFTISNSGGLPLVVQSASVSGPFQITANSCTGPVSPGSSCHIGVVFNPAAAGPASGNFSITCDGSPQTAPLKGNGVVGAVVVLYPAALNFNSVLTGTTSAPQTITVTNSGGISISIQASAVSGPFRIVSNSCVSPLAAGAVCSVSIVFMPVANGASTGSFSITDDAGTQPAPLSGTGVVPPAIFMLPDTKDFGTVPLGSTSSVQYFTISNVEALGLPSIALHTPTITGPFQITTNLCGSSLAPSYGCTVRVVFVPAASGAAGGLLSITDDAGTQIATLIGAGQTAATSTLAPLSLTFAPQAVNTASAAQQVTLTNSGDASLKLITTAITGDFTVVNSCGNSLTGHSACAFSVVYDPTKTGAETGTLTVTDLVNTQIVQLQGSGLAPPGVSVTPASVDFGAVSITGTSGPQAVTVTNNGGASLSALAFNITGDFTIASSSCSATLDISASCAVQVVFSPSAAGARSGNLTVTSSSFPTPVNVALTGIGSDFQFLISGSSSATIISGQTALYHVQVVPVAGSGGTVSITCSGAPANSTCTANPASAQLNGNSTIFVSIQVATGISTAAGSVNTPMVGRLVAIATGGCALALLLPTGARRRRFQRFLAMLCCGTFLLALGACGVGASAGSGSAPKPSTPASTPIGTYLIAITAGVPGVQKTVTVTLTIE